MNPDNLFLIDTNILVFAYNREAEKKHEISRENDIKKVYTDNKKDFDKFPGIEAFDPLNG